MNNLSTNWLKAIIASTAFLSPIASAADLKVTVANIVEQEGSLMIALVASEQGFNEEEPPIASLLLKPAGEQTSFTLHNLVPGSYGIRVLHDVNGNDKMDANLVGMPTEPWGFSNDATGKFGPPKWDAVKLSVTEDVQTIINLNR